MLCACMLYKVGCMLHTLMQGTPRTHKHARYSEYSQPCDPRGLRRVRSARPTAAGPAPPAAASSARRERVVDAGRANAVTGVLVVPREERLGGRVRADDLANAVLTRYSEYSRGNPGTHTVPFCRARADDHEVLSGYSRGTHVVLTWGLY